MSKQPVDTDKVIFALMVSDTQEQACKMLNVGRNYISEKKKDPAFQKRYREFKQDLLKKTSEQLLAYNLDAIKTLHRLLESPNDSVQVASAKSILNYSKDFYMLSDLQARIEQLEQAEVDE